MWAPSSLELEWDKMLCDWEGLSGLGACRVGEGTASGVVPGSH